MDNERGLYVKYIVTKADSGELVNSCFVLRPSKDPHAYAALKAYAESCKTDNPTLWNDIQRWLNVIEQGF